MFGWVSLEAYQDLVNNDVVIFSKMKFFYDYKDGKIDSYNATEPWNG